MNKWQRTDVLKVSTVTRTSCGYLPSLVKRIARGPKTHQVSAQFVQPLLRYEKGVRSAHVQLCPSLNFCKSRANGSQTTYRISAQSVKPFLRYGKVAHLHVRTLSLVCVNCLVFNNIPNFGAIRPAVPKIEKRGAHVRTCRCPHPY